MPGLVPTLSGSFPNPVDSVEEFALLSLNMNCVKAIVSPAVLSYVSLWAALAPGIAPFAAYGMAGPETGAARKLGGTRAGSVPTEGGGAFCKPGGITTWTVGGHVSASPGAGCA